MLKVRIIILLQVKDNHSKSQPYAFFNKSFLIIFLFFASYFFGILMYKIN